MIPVTDTDRIAALCKEKQVNGILTSFSDLLLECMVKISAKAGLPCYLNPEQLPWYRDKSATRGLLEELGLPSPGFAKIPTSGLAPELIAHLHFPLVTKPLDKYGSRGIYVVHNLEELKQAITETASFTDLPEILVEEYNDGYEFNMMTWYIKESSCDQHRRREKTDIGPGEIPISTRNVYPSCLYEQVVAPATDLLQCYADKTGQKEGALSMQFFWKPENGIQVCEIAARFFGYEHELTDMVYGFSIEDLLLNYLYDVPALEQMLDTKRHFGKLDKRQGYHFIISFEEEEVTEDTAFELIGKFVKEYLGPDFEAVYAIHNDTDHIHGHIIFNSVRCTNGYKYDYPKGEWEYRIQPLVNRLCEEYGLSTLDMEEVREKRKRKDIPKGQEAEKRVP